MSEFKRRLKRFLREHGPRSKPKLPPGVIIPEDLTDEERRARVARAEEMVGKKLESAADIHAYIVGPEALAKRGVAIRRATREDFIEHLRKRGVEPQSDGFYYTAPGRRARLDADVFVGQKLNPDGWVPDEEMSAPDGSPVKYSWWGAECDAKTGELITIFD